MSFFTVSRQIETTLYKEQKVAPVPPKKKQTHSSSSSETASLGSKGSLTSVGRFFRRKSSRDVPALPLPHDAPPSPHHHHNHNNHHHNKRHNIGSHREELPSRDPNYRLNSVSSELTTSTQASYLFLNSSSSLHYKQNPSVPSLDSRSAGFMSHSSLHPSLYTSYLSVSQPGSSITSNFLSPSPKHHGGSQSLLIHMGKPPSFSIPNDHCLNTGNSANNSSSGNNNHGVPPPPLSLRHNSTQSFHLTLSLPPLNARQSSQARPNLQFSFSTSKAQSPQSTVFDSPKVLPRSLNAGHPTQLSLRPRQGSAHRVATTPVNTPPDDDCWLVGEVVIPKFRPHLSKGFLNSDTLTASMASPEAQILRYNSFVDSLAEQQWNDAVNFANVRLLSLMKFTMRHQNTIAMGLNPHGRTKVYYEGVLSYEMIRMRIFMRDMMMYESRNSQRRSCIAEDRELMQLNFANYLAYLLRLPTEVDPSSSGDTWLQMHYHHRHTFLEIADALYQLEQTSLGNSTNTSFNSGQVTSIEAEEQSAAQNANGSRVTLLLKAIAKVAYEYNLLETYQIQIFAKLNSNSLLELSMLESLYKTHKSRLERGLTVLPKVMVFNINHSSQYVWEMGVTMPFVRVFELNVFNENEALISDTAAYRSLSAQTSKVDFGPSDQALHDTYFLKLFLGSFKEYREMSTRKLVQLHRHLDNKSLKYSHVNIHDNPHPSITYSHKPVNVEFYDKSLMTIPSNSFSTIQTRDLMFQLNLKTFDTVLAEFYRILEPGGVLEVPMIQAGDDELKRYIEGELVAKRVYQTALGNGFSRWSFSEIENVLEHFDLIQEFPQTLFRELHKLFGSANVRYNIVLLNSCNDINEFLYKLNSLSLFAILGRFDEYCARLMEEQSAEGGNIRPDSSFQYVIHIVARKPEDK